VKESLLCRFLVLKILVKFQWGHHSRQQDRQTHVGAKIDDSRTVASYYVGNGRRQRPRTCRRL